MIGNSQNKKALQMVQPFFCTNLLTLPRRISDVSIQAWFENRNYSLKIYTGQTMVLSFLPRAIRPTRQFCQTLKSLEPESHGVQNDFEH